MEAPTERRSVTEWDENDVRDWLTSLGLSQYQDKFREHRISGDILCMLDADALKGVGVSTIGQRLNILKNVYHLKVHYNIPFDVDDWVPPSEAQERSENLTLDKLHTIVKDQDRRLRYLEEENRNLNTTLQSFLDDYNGLRASLSSRTDDSDPSLRRQHSFKWAQFKPTKSPTKPEMAVDSPHPSPQQLEHDIPPYTRGNPQSQITSATTAPDKSRLQPLLSDSPNNSQVSAPKPTRQESSDNLKSFKVSLEDPTWKVLPAALKKYRINNDNWENYAMFICYGSPGNRIERCLSYDEKPLLLFQKLKDAKKNPVFMLKHIKDIRSPIAVAQQKHAARKASSVMSNDSNVASSGHTKGAPSRSITRPPRLEVNDLSTSTPLLTGVSPQPNWPEQDVSSPSNEHQKGPLEEGSSAPGSAGTGNNSVLSTGASSSTVVGSTYGSHDPSKSRGGSSESMEQPSSTSREMPVASAGVSYAVAIYPYMAEQEDEFDVVVGDTFVILSRARGWWVVQRDPTGSGIVDTDIIKQGWVPAGCLLETNVPVASAIAEATAAKGSSSANGESSPSRTPILPLSIISTSFPGIALMDYKKKGEEELDLVKDDALRVFKRYNHWSYAVKEDGGDRGWVPSWFIGKVAPAGNVPPTPSTSVPPNNSSGNLDDGVSGQPQVSPMSSAFPPQQTRTPNLS
ncbi:hypothetical protein K435DRAFT_780687 [Dendrothele bispora CBS 962.96]|uniref:RA-domain-containing protein n=1 Tax=Dendrothele bispora (strain CBS 962.96) TaxID=1314807 RepID=A0A4V4HEP1_DENBC|nr:hypothetical protein K435DRAFT_780687 [Dendrothele bispora CBS 962.96]